MDSKVRLSPPPHASPHSPHSPHSTRSSPIPQEPAAAAQRKRAREDASQPEPKRVRAAGHGAPGLPPARPAAEAGTADPATPRLALRDVTVAPPGARRSPAPADRACPPPDDDSQAACADAPDLTRAWLMGLSGTARVRGLRDFQRTMSGVYAGLVLTARRAELGGLLREPPPVGAAERLAWRSLRCARLAALAPLLPVDDLRRLEAIAADDAHLAGFAAADLATEVLRRADLAQVLWAGWGTGRRLEAMRAALTVQTPAAAAPAHVRTAVFALRAERLRIACHGLDTQGLEAAIATALDPRGLRELPVPQRGLALRLRGRLLAVAHARLTDDALERQWATCRSEAGVPRHDPAERAQALTLRSLQFDALVAQDSHEENLAAIAALEAPAAASGGASGLQQELRALELERRYCALPEGTARERIHASAASSDLLPDRAALDRHARQEMARTRALEWHKEQRKPPQQPSPSPEPEPGPASSPPGLSEPVAKEEENPAPG